jgi:hypothetical protein
MLETIKNKRLLWAGHVWRSKNPLIRKWYAEEKTAEKTTTEMGRCIGVITGVHRNLASLSSNVRVAFLFFFQIYIIYSNYS